MVLIRQRLILAVILTSIYIGAYAQNASFSGTVTDSKTGEPVEGASVWLSVSTITYTNAEGQFLIKGLDEGKYRVRISHSGIPDIF